MRIRFYMVSDYYATGEGTTKSFMITDIYKLDGHSDDTPQFLAEERFSRQFGGYFASGVECLEREEFFERCGNWIPEPVKKLDQSDAGAFSWHQQVYANFS